jgi:hypothetical protein
MLNVTKYLINDVPVVTLLTKRDYGYFLYLIHRKGMNPTEAYIHTKKTLDKRKYKKSKYNINGEPIYKLLSEKDYGYFQVLIHKKKMSIQKAYQQTIETRGGLRRKKDSAFNRKYYYNGVSIREIFTNKTDRNVFYNNRCVKKMKVKDAVEATLRTIKAREKRWEQYRKEKAQLQRI